MPRVLGHVTFDEFACGWRNDFDWNVMFLKRTEDHINDIIRHRGYIYLNQIYEQLGVKWDPLMVNPCVINNEIDPIIFF